MNQTIGRQLSTGFAIAAIAIVATVIVATVALRSATQAKDLVIERDSKLVSDSAELEAAVLDVNVSINRFLFTGDERWLPTATAEGRVEELLTDLEEGVHTATGTDLVQRVRLEFGQFQHAADEVVALRQGTDDVKAVAAAAAIELYPARDTMLGSVRMLHDREQRLIAESVATSNARASGATWLVWGLGLVALLAALGTALMTTRRVSRRVSALSDAVGSAAHDVLAATSQQVVGASEQATAIQQTVTTVDELVQSAEETARRAHAVSQFAHRSSTTAETGRNALSESLSGMAFVQRQVEAIAESTLALANRAQSISEIIGTVEDIAEQTNMLALNAAIEAARAGEQGRGFAVVAAEVRSLAEESKAATARVDNILQEIQQATNRAVMATEEGTKSVTEGLRLVADADETINELADIVSDASASAEQIAAAAGQQAGATSQISEAMRDVNSAMEQTVASARQAEHTARTLNEIAGDLRGLVRHTA